MMCWHSRFKIRHGRRVQSASEKLVQLGRRRFGAILNPAELQVLEDAASSRELPSPEEDAPSPEDQYDENTPRPEVRSAFLYWLATDLEARPHVHAKGIRVYCSTITGDLDLGEHLQITNLDFRRCTLNCQIVLEGSEIRSVKITDCVISRGIRADGSVVHGPVVLNRTKSEGEISFKNAMIENNFECHGAKLTTEGVSLSLDGATIKGDLFCDKDFLSSGEISLIRAHIEGSASFSGANLMGKEDALTLDKVKIGGNLLLNGKLKCAGKIRLPNCNIEGDLNFMGAEVRAVLCYNMSLFGDLFWHGIQKTPETDLDLRRARVKTLRDDEASWPADDHINLDNFVYEDLILHRDPTNEEVDRGTITRPLPLEVDKRIQWLKLQPGRNQLRPQPWVQLSRLLESMNKADAKHVIYKFRYLQAQRSRWLKYLWIPIARLEENPLRILYVVVIPTLFFGTLIFAGADRSGAMVPTARDGYGLPLSGAALAHYPPFKPFVYTLENAVPLVRVGIDDKWTPDPAHSGRAWFPRCPWLNWLGWFNSYGFLADARCAIIFLGWFNAAVMGAALTTRFKP